MHPSITASWIANAARVYLNGYTLPLPDDIVLTTDEAHEVNAAIRAYNQQRLADETDMLRIMHVTRDWSDWEGNCDNYIAGDEPDDGPPW